MPSSVDASPAEEGKTTMLWSRRLNIPTQVQSQGISFSSIEPADHIISLRFNKESMSKQPPVTRELRRKSPHHVLVSRVAALETATIDYTSTLTVTGIYRSSEDVEVNIEGHPQSQNSQGSLEVIKINVKGPSTKKQTDAYICDRCGCRFLESSDFHRHFRESHPNEERSFQCVECEMHFEKINHPPPSVDRQKRIKNQCDKYNTKLREHTRTLTNGLLYECLKCLRKFALKRDLDIHLLTHFEESCAICSEKFLTKDFLNHHLRFTNTTKESFQCSKCSEKFEEKKYLNVHFETHLGGKPFKDTDQPSKFTQKDRQDRQLFFRTGDKLLLSLKFRETGSFDRRLKNGS